MECYPISPFLRSHYLVVRTNINDAPVILSTPVDTVLHSVTYYYHVIAEDPDKDALGYMLLSAPSGMTIDDATGLITWPDDGARIDNSHVEVQVSDDSGAVALQSWNISLKEDIDPPHVNIVLSYNPVVPGQIVTVTVEAWDNVEVDSLELYVDSVLVTLEENYQYFLNTFIEDTIELTARSVDVNENEGSFTTFVYVSQDADNEAPIVTVYHSPDYPLVGESVVFTVEVTDDKGVEPDQIWLKVGDEYLPLEYGSAELTPLMQGNFPVIATAYDYSGNYGEGFEYLLVTVDEPNDMAAPVAEIILPEIDTEVYGQADILGTATDENFAWYTLSYCDINENEFIRFDEGYDPVFNGNLGKVDATNMDNGVYRIRLTVYDKFQNSSIAETRVVIVGNQKIGQFSLAFSDMSINLPGINLEVTRTYDSRVKTKGDFGVGWRIDIKSVKLHEKGKQGEDWEVGLVDPFYPILGYYIAPLSDHGVMINIPGGRTQVFDVVPHFFTVLVPTVGYITYEPRPGTYSTLEQLDAGTFYMMGGELYDPDNLLETYNPNIYKLTLTDGTYYIINQNPNGNLSIGDPNNNTVTITNDDINHSSGGEITINRDEENRITSIVDADGRTIQYVYDGHGNLQKVIDAKGNVTRFKYLPDHYLLEIIDPRGVKATRTEYDEDGRMVRQINPAGDTLYFDHDIDNKIETTTDFNGNATQYTYDERGNVLSKNDAANNTWTYEYDDLDNLLRAVDPYLNDKISEWDDKGNEISTTNERNYTTTRTFTELGRIKTETDPLNRTTTYNYDTKGNLLSVVGPDATVTEERTYDGFGNVLTEKDGEGNLTQYEYDSQGRMTARIDPLGRRIEYVLDNRGNTLAEINAKGDTTGYFYDNNDNQTIVINAYGDSTKSTYNVFNKIASQTDARGNTTVFEYDLFGQLGKTIAPDGSFTQRTYDGQGNILTTTDEVDRTTSFNYDYENRLVKTTLNDGSFTEVEYDALGRRTASIDAKNNRTEYEYDEVGNNTLVRDALLNETTYEYDEVNRRTAMVDALNQRTDYLYDDYDRLARTTFHDGTYKEIGYNDAGRKISETDQESKMTEFVYDSVGNLKKVIDAMLFETEYTYDENNNRTSQEDANDHVTTMDYDKLNRLVNRTYPNSDEERFGYDANGNMIYRVAGTFSAGDSTAFEYDLRNREIYRWYSNSGHTVETKYTSDSKRDTVIDYRGMTIYEWGDCCGKIKKVVNPDNTFVEYEYDYNRNKTAMITPWNTTEYTYDELNRMKNIISDGDVTEYFYNNVGNRDSVKHANSTSVGYEYDDLNRLTRVTNYSPTGSIISSYTYELNNAGIRTAVIEADNSRVDYGYDDLYRLNSETRSGTNAYSISYTYDDVGNRLTKDHDGDITTYEYNNRDQLIIETTPTQTIIYTFDSAGRTKTKTDSTGTTTYSWIDNDRLAGVQSSTVTVSYNYDFDGIKVSMNDGSKTKNYLIDKIQPYAQVIAEYDNNNNLNVEYVFGLERIKQDRSGFVSFYLADGQGSVRQLANISGNVTDTYDYYAFGEELARTGTTKNEFQYVGEQYDPNTNFYYLRARWMDPKMGRFVSMDPFIGDSLIPISLQRYLYVNDNPVMMVDPNGRHPLLIAAILTVTIASNLASHATPVLLRESMTVNCNYSQSSGLMVCNNEFNVEIVREVGYSGRGEGLNNPEMQDVPNVGPIPLGLWWIHPGYINHKKLGPITIILTPTYSWYAFRSGRHAFRIHGDNSKMNYTASEGCIILSRKSRLKIVKNNKAGGRLTVE